MKFGKFSGNNSVVHRVVQSGWRADRAVCGRPRYRRFYSGDSIATVPHFDDPWEFKKLPEEERILQILAMGEKIAQLPDWVWNGKPCGGCFPQARAEWDAKHPHCDTCSCEGKVRA